MLNQPGRARAILVIVAYVLPIALIVHAIGFWERGIIDGEATALVIKYLQKRPLLDKIFDPLSNDWGPFQARELSHVFDLIDARSGTASPAYYGIRAQPMYTSDAVQTVLFPPDRAEELLGHFLHEHADCDPNVVVRTTDGDRVVATVVKTTDSLRLRPGTYFVSASLLQPVTPAAWAAIGPWNLRVEQEYQKGCALVAPLLSNDIATRRAALARYPSETWRGILRDYGYLRFYRLAAFLRQREPDEEVNYSILVYHLNEDDLSRALNGPPAELGPDLLGQSKPK